MSLSIEVIKRKEAELYYKYSFLRINTLVLLKELVEQSIFLSPHTKTPSLEVFYKDNKDNTYCELIVIDEELVLVDLEGNYRSIDICYIEKLLGILTDTVKLI